MFKKILIANRGEIVCRVASTARRLGLATVAVYSDADAKAKHVRACDEAVHIGLSAPKESYLRIERIVAAARATGAQAVHPGYGFLSENEDFAQACADAGLVFIGPPPSAIRAMGLKAESKRLMAHAGVPLVPGYHGADQDPALLQREADAIGYPVLIKASAGGGGKGMRVVNAAAEFAAALASCQREARSSFGDDAVLIERYVTRPRHIEIQVFADSQGQCIHLFERDCSVQRRHQKVLEEAPAPGMTPERRRAMGEAAVAAARAVGYVGAGTVEFIAEPVAGSNELRFYFMEMNTRLQVEHPVTEAITGLDLVEWQLRVAAGEPLPLSQDQVPLRGHAIEARLCAENPDRQFMPSTGTLQVLRLPAASTFKRAVSEHAFLRVDSSVREGDVVTPFYDPMLAKIIVWGETRAQALARMDAALAATHVVGVHTNAAFLQRVVNSRSFAEADLDTALIEREREALFNAAPLRAELAAAAVVAQVLAAEQGVVSSDPWSRRDGWRLSGEARRWFELQLGEQAVTAVLHSSRDGRHWLALGDAARLEFDARPLGGDRYDIQLGGRRVTLSAYAVGRQVAVFAQEGSAIALRIDAFDRVGSIHGASVGGLTAPMPGKIVAFLVQPGQPVKQGQPLAVLEAMKMEHTIASPREGRVQALLFAPGDAVAEGSELLRLE